MKGVEPGFFEVKDKDLAARIGRLYTPHGWLETPALLPVIDIVRQEVPVIEVKNVGFKAVITNAYLLWKRMKSFVLEKGVHTILGFDGIVMTDSGAYQILEYGRVEITPREVVEFEKSIGSDIAVILDVPTGNARDRAQAVYSVEETLRRAHDALNYIDPERRVWTLPIQGGFYIDLLENSAERSARLIGPYKLLALGSPTVLLERYEYSTILDMVFTVRRRVPWSIPLHLFGAGHPMIIPYAVALGVDLFDSASYILYARDNRYMTRTRTYRLEELEYFPCNCPVCSKYTPQELRQMPRDERVKLLALHNLYVLKTTIDEVKQAIREGRLWELLEERSASHPSIKEAFTKFRKTYARYIALHSPRTKGDKARGVFLYGAESMAHPKLLQHHESLLRRYKSRKKSKAVLIPITKTVKPFTRSKLYRQVKKDKVVHVLGYAPYIGVVPEELSETYPLSQFEANYELVAEVAEETARRVVEYLQRNKYQTVEIVSCKTEPWAETLTKHIHKKAMNKGIEIEVTRLESCE